MNTATDLLRYVGTTLADQLVHLAITLVVIDQLLKWRERRRWKDVSPLVYIQIEAALGDIVRGWAHWLAAVEERATPIELSVEGQAWLEENPLAWTPALACRSTTSRRGTGDGAAR